MAAAGQGGESGTLRAIGLMSGTSLDGVDAALVETDGKARVATGLWITIPYDEARRGQLKAALSGRGVPEAERALTEAHAEAVFALLREAGLVPDDIAVIGFPGHTIAHRPEAGVTWQIGDGARLAEITGIDVVSDFRRRDVAAGGQGAPLAPLYHRALAQGLARPLAVLNIGGVANVTWIGEGEALQAFDTGPGCALLDEWAERHTGQRFDANGALAREGRPDEAVLAAWLREPYFARRPPKSLDRRSFTLAPVAALSPAAGAATLAAFTARAAARAVRHFPAPAGRWLVTGGGRRNPAIMEMLAKCLRGVSVEPVEVAGWQGDALEAQAFGYLAVRSLKGLPLSLPQTTGVARPVSGGAVHRAGGRSRTRMPFLDEN